jgi:predicted amidohydrolase
MKFALASKEFIDNDIKSNLRVILSSMKEASKLKCDFILLGESFLQGIECLN